MMFRFSKAPRQSVNQPAQSQPQPQQELLKVKAKYNFPGNVSKSICI